MTWLHFYFYNCFHNAIISYNLSIKAIVRALFDGEDGFFQPKMAEAAIFYPEYKEDFQTHTNIIFLVYNTF